MEIALILLFSGVAIGLLRGGSIERLIDARLRFAALLLAAVAIQVYFAVWPPEWLTRSNAVWVYLVSQLLAVVFLAFNRHLPGVLLVGIGLALNMAVIASNGAMPVSETASRVAGTEFLTDHRHVEHGLHLRNEILDGQTIAPWLSDVIPIPGIAQVISLGDVVLAAGIFVLVISLMTQRGDGLPRRDVVISAQAS
ncbi:MAG: DUF5317 domain-containing protein [Actinobacteria bacterium]|nr:DUF5317 domain-containing protein [Actinomycetota bacterium]